MASAAAPRRSCGSSAAWAAVDSFQWTARTRHPLQGLAGVGPAAAAHAAALTSRAGTNERPPTAATRRPGSLLLRQLLRRRSVCTDGQHVPIHGNGWRSVWRLRCCRQRRRHSWNLPGALLNLHAAWLPTCPATCKLAVRCCRGHHLLSCCATPVVPCGSMSEHGMTSFPAVAGAPAQQHGARDTHRGPRG